MFGNNLSNNNFIAKHCSENDAWDKRFYDKLHRQKFS